MKLKLGSVGLKLMLKKYLNNMRLCLKWTYPCLCYVFVLALSQNHCWPSFHFSKNHWPFHRWQWWAAKPFIQWQWSSCTKTIEKPSTTMVLWQKPLTIPSCSKFDHRCGLIGVHCWCRLIFPKWFRPKPWFSKFFHLQQSTSSLIQPSIHTFDLGIARKQSSSSFTMCQDQNPVQHIVNS